MNAGHNESYSAAGVDVTAGYKAVELMKKHVARTKIPGVLEGIGGFGGLFALPDMLDIQEPVLVSGADGVGTKLQIARIMDKHDTIGVDAVAMCVNDIVCAGAKPLFFLDYIAAGKVIPEKIEQIVSGVAEGCVLAGCALIGGETAEHPGVMPDDEYDIAGFAVGIVDKSKILDKAAVRPGDAVIGIASSGVHSNGFSLTRKVLQTGKALLGNYSAELGRTFGEELLIPTKIYVKPVLTLLEKLPVRSVSHITGGGFYENIPRGISEGSGAVIELANIEIPPIFTLIQKTGGVPQRDMFNTYNMGVGMCVITAPEHADEAVRVLNGCGEKAKIIGEVKSGIEGVVLA
ncbi:MAG: phosphoribosylformylglycinamidine cyclo-ligase [Synergistaceae bacterium]|nr:phosphoribosylformylglycinamidine cyclo-ligase [Synergistaceae bacterium]